MDGLPLRLILLGVRGNFKIQGTSRVLNFCSIIYLVFYFLSYLGFGLSPSTATIHTFLCDPPPFALFLSCFSLFFWFNKNIFQLPSSRPVATAETSEIGSETVWNCLFQLILRLNDNFSTASAYRNRRPDCNAKPTFRSSRVHVQKYWFWRLYLVLLWNQRRWIVWVSLVMNRSDKRRPTVFLVRSIC